MEWVDYLIIFLMCTPPLIAGAFLSVCYKADRQIEKCRNKREGKK